MKEKYDLIVFMGRFQPFHSSHQKVIKRALEMSRFVLVLIGSAGSARTLRNPFTYIERKHLMNDAMGSMRVDYQPLYDTTYNNLLWAKQVQQKVQKTLPCAKKIAIIGRDKDETSYYLHMFPQWDLIECDDFPLMNATDIRNWIYLDGLEDADNWSVPKNVMTWLKEEYVPSENWAHQCEVFEYIKKYKLRWGSKIHNTVDAVVIQSGHILLIERGEFYGKGMLALPGGFLNQDETHIDGMIRELREETKLKVPIPVLKGSIKKTRTFDDPKRSDRGRIITNATLIELKHDKKLPRVKGSSDAKKAFWLPLGQLQEDKMFEDHFHIVNTLIGEY